jgi:hypothetical protein
MLAALNAHAVRVRGTVFSESRWALPVNEFDPNDYDSSGSEYRAE